MILAYENVELSDSKFQLYSLLCSRRIAVLCDELLFIEHVNYSSIHSSSKLWMHEQKSLATLYGGWMNFDQIITINIKYICPFTTSVQYEMT